jgi:hypothetical protein
MIEMPSVRYDVQRSENKRKNSFLNYESLLGRRCVQESSCSH